MTVEQKGVNRKMSAISTRLPECCVEYTAHGRRLSKEFSDANEARRFYVAKDKAGACPVVKRVWRLSKQGQALFEDVKAGLITLEEIVRGKLLSDDDYQIIEEWQRQEEDDGQERLVDHQRRLMQWTRKRYPRYWKACREFGIHSKESHEAFQADRAARKGARGSRGGASEEEGEEA